MKKRALLAGPAVLLGTVLFVATADAQSETPAQPPAAQACAAPEHHQLDFWIGEWEAKDGKTGQVLGTSSISSILGGCVIQERWTSPGGSGTSLILYRPADRKWHYTWVDDKGSLLPLTGGLEGNRMVVSGQAPGRDGKVSWSRLSWEKVPPDRVHSTYETSPDGKTWTLAFDGIYVPKK